MNLEKKIQFMKTKFLVATETSFWRWCFSFSLNWSIFMPCGALVVPKVNHLRCFIYYIYKIMSYYLPTTLQVGQSSILDFSARCKMNLLGKMIIKLHSLNREFASRFVWDFPMVKCLPTIIEFHANKAKLIIYNTFHSYLLK